MEREQISRVVHRMMTVAFCYAFIFGRMTLEPERYKAAMDVMYGLWGGISLAYIIGIASDDLKAFTNERRRGKLEREIAEKKDAADHIAKVAAARAAEVNRFYYGSRDND